MYAGWALTAALGCSTGNSDRRSEALAEGTDWNGCVEWRVNGKVGLGGWRESGEVNAGSIVPLFTPVNGYLDTLVPWINDLWESLFDVAWRCVKAKK